MFQCSPGDLLLLTMPWQVPATKPADPGLAEATVPHAHGLGEGVRRAGLPPTHQQTQGDNGLRAQLLRSQPCASSDVQSSSIAHRCSAGRRGSWHRGLMTRNRHGTTRSTDTGGCVLGHSTGSNRASGRAQSMEGTPLPLPCQRQAGSLFQSVFLFSPQRLLTCSPPSLGQAERWRGAAVCRLAGSPPHSCPLSQCHRAGGLHGLLCHHSISSHLEQHPT